MCVLVPYYPSGILRPSRVGDKYTPLRTTGLHPTISSSSVRTTPTPGPQRSHHRLVVSIFPSAIVATVPARKTTPSRGDSSVPSTPNFCSRPDGRAAAGVTPFPNRRPTRRLASRRSYSITRGRCRCPVDSARGARPRSTATGKDPRPRFWLFLVLLWSSEVENGGPGSMIY